MTILAASLALLAGSAPLVLAQEASQQSASQNQYMNPYVNEAQTVAPNLQDITSLDANGNLVVNCASLLERLDQLAQEGYTVKANPELDLVLAQTEDLAQLCVDDGFTPPSSG